MGFHAGMLKQRSFFYVELRSPRDNTGGKLEQREKERIPQFPIPPTACDIQPSSDHAQCARTGYVKAHVQTASARPPVAGDGKRQRHT